MGNITETDNNCDHKYHTKKENEWERYEYEKQTIAATSKTSEEYRRRIKCLIKKLGI